MRAAILAIGSELLGTERLDTNSLRLTRVLEDHGVELVTKEVLGDDEGQIAEELGRLLSRVDLVLVTGGLGPTADDVTREAAARALGRPLAFDEAICAEIERRFEAMGRTMARVNRKQAEVPEGAEVIDNRRGTAPGLRLTADGGATLFLFPGVPRELEGMVESHLIPWLAERSGGLVRETAFLKVACVPESELEERIAPVYEEFGREGLSVLARPGDITLEIRAGGDAAARAERLEAVTRRLVEIIGPAVYGHRREDDLETVVGRLLAERGETLVTAESCTGGLLGERLTRVPGSSAWYLGGAVTYSNDLKERLLGVPAELLEEHGAVSEAVARAMAAGAREHLGGDWAIAITGVAGPGGGTEDKPVGLVHLAWAGPGAPAGAPAGAPGDDAVEARHFRFPGDRQTIRRLASQVGLEGLRRRLLRSPLPSAGVSDGGGAPRGTP